MTGEADGVVVAVTVGTGVVAVGSTVRLGLGTGADSPPQDAARMTRMLRAASRRIARHATRPSSFGRSVAWRTVPRLTEADLASKPVSASQVTRAPLTEITDANIAGMGHGGTLMKRVAPAGCLAGMTD